LSFSLSSLSLWNPDSERFAIPSHSRKRHPLSVNSDANRDPVPRCPPFQRDPTEHPKRQGDPFLKKARGVHGIFSGAINGLKQMNILIVEDHQDTRRVLSTLLRRANHEVISASGVTDALQLLQNMRVNVLLSDLGLTDGDGLDLVKKAKKLQPTIKAVALTARSTAKDHQLGRRAGFDHYLTKPFDFHELRTLLSVLKSAA
jgi:CheY-like chemotaxis protein